MEAKRRALGRGLGALIPVAAEPAATRDSRGADFTLPIDIIDVNPYQPRSTFADEAIEELSRSIREKGLLQPLLVRRIGNRYQLIAGERRFRAAQRAGLEKIPVNVREADDREMLELALIENLQREDLNPVEEARAYQRLAQEFSLNQDEIARRVGKSRSTVANGLRLLQLPEDLLAQVANRTLSPGHARGLLSIPSPELRAEAARAVVQRKLSVRDTERLARTSRATSQDLDRQAIEEELSRSLGTRVRIQGRKGNAGRIEIEYYSLGELDGLIQRLTGPT